MIGPIPGRLRSSQFAISLDGGDQLAGQGLLEGLELGDLDLQLVPQMLLPDRAQEGPELGGFGSDVFVHAQLLAQLQQAWAGCRSRCLERGCGGGDQLGIEPVVLGSLPVQPGKQPHLERLVQHRGEAGCRKLGASLTLIATAGFEPNPLDRMAPEPADQRLDPRPVVAHPDRVAAGDGHIQPELAHVDPGRLHARVLLLHLTHPCGFGPYRPCNHPGDVKRRRRPGSVAALGLRGHRPLHRQPRPALLRRTGVPEDTQL